MNPPAKNTIARCLNLALFLGGCLLAGTGWALDQRLLRGRDHRGDLLFGLDRHEWGDVHAWAGYAIVALALAHLALHGAWLHKIAATRRPWRLVAGFGLGALIVLAFMLAPVGRD